MAWIESHQKLEKHPKLLELCSKTGWDKPTVIGTLHMLWWWALDYAEDGDLSRYDPSVPLGDLCRDLDAKDLFQMLIDTNFIEKNGIIHDWLDYAGRYLYSKYHTANPKKLKQIQKKFKSVNRRTYLTTKGNLPTLTNQPNQPNHIISSQIENLLSQFSNSMKEKVLVYIDRARARNKSKVITDGRKLTLLTELYNSRSRCNDDQLFSYALDMAISYDAPNVNYINSVIKNKRTERPR